MSEIPIAGTLKDIVAPAGTVLSRSRRFVSHRGGFHNGPLYLSRIVLSRCLGDRLRCGRLSPTRLDGPLGRLGVGPRKHPSTGQSERAYSKYRNDSHT